MTITRAESEALKGVAILLMVIHHLFGLPTLIREPSHYVSTIPGLPLDYFVGVYGKVCVALFLMLSGYGLAVSRRIGRAATLGRLKRFYVAYWAYFLVIVGFGALFFGELPGPGGMRFDLAPFRFVTNALALRHDYVYEWWFAEVYIVLVAVAPLIVPQGARPYRLLAVSAAAFLLGAALDVLHVRWPVLHPANLLIWQFPFVMGVVAAVPNGPFTRLPGPAISAVVVGIGSLAVAWIYPAGQTPWLIVTAPLSLVAWLAFVRWIRGGEVEKGLRWFGHRSLAIWLVHPALVYHFAQPLAYAPVWAPLVFAMLLALTLAVVLPVEWVRTRLPFGADRAGT